MSRAGVVDEDSAHHPSRDRKEVRAVVPGDVPSPSTSRTIRLVDERRRLEAVPRALAGHAAPRDLVQLAMDERNQALEGTLVALPPLEQQPGDVRGMVSNAPILAALARARSRVPFPRLRRQEEEDGRLTFAIKSLAPERPENPRTTGAAI